MSEQRSVEVRSCALDFATRVIPEGQPTGHFLSTARAFHRYILTGFSSVGANTDAVELGRTGVWLRVELAGVDDALAARYTAAVREAVEGIQRPESVDSRAPGVSSDLCHCGGPEDNLLPPDDEGYSRAGLCDFCASVRCDVNPGACGR